MSETVKACPFCGEKADLIDLDPHGANPIEVRAVVCRECQASSPHMHSSSATGAARNAITAWNTRAADAENQRLREALEVADKMILQHCNPEDGCMFRGDWACAECKPYSEILKPGFRCAFHAAKDRMDTAFAKALDAAKGGEA